MVYDGARDNVCCTGSAFVNGSFDHFDTVAFLHLLDVSVFWRISVGNY